MKNQKISFIGIFILMFLLGSCKAYRNPENINPKVLKEMQTGPFDKSELKKLILGDRITVNASTGFKYHMIYQNYTGGNLVGSVWKVNKEKLEVPQKTEIPFEEIDQVRVRRVSVAATAPFVALGILVTLGGILAIALSSGLGFGW